MFSAWLVEFTSVYAVNDPVRLQAVLARHDCHSTVGQVREWMEGTIEPSYDKMRSILSALQKELVTVDVWDHYASFTRDDAQAPARRPRPGTETDLESLLRDHPRLPPGLEP